MGKVWVLDTETKGTGANMVPLDRVLRKGTSSVPGFALPELKPPAPKPVEPRAPRRFRVVDVVTREVLADDADARIVALQRTLVRPRPFHFVVRPAEAKRP